MVEADIHLKPLHTPISDIYKVFELFVCCLKVIWVHPYTVTLVKLAPIFGKSGLLVECKNGAITSQLRSISISDCYPHPH